MMNADDIERAQKVLGSRAYLVPDDLGVEQGYEAWLEVTHAARAHASLLRSIETGAIRERVARLASVGHFDALEAFDQAEMLYIADLIIALFREGEPKGDDLR